MEALKAKNVFNFSFERHIYLFAVPENFHTHPMEGHWKFRRGGGSQKPKFFKGRCEAKLEIPGGVGKTKNPSVGEVWIFSGTTQ